MSDTNDTTRTARPGGRQPLSLKKTETSTVKQSFSHGRTKAVVVEKKRARVAPGQAKPGAAAEKPGQLPKAAETSAASAAPQQPAREAPSRSGVVLRQLTDEEKEARSRALADARVEEEHARKRAEEEAKLRAAEEVRLAKERAEAEKRKAEEDARKSAEETARKRAEEEASRRLEKEKKDEAAPAAKAEPAAADAVRRPKPVVEEEEESAGNRRGGAGKAAPKGPTPARKGADIRRRGKLTVTRALSDDDERTRSVAAFRRHLQRVNKGQQAQAAGPAGPREVTVPETITVAELANRMARRAVDVIKVLMKNGIMATVNDVIDADTAELVATEYGHVAKPLAESDEPAAPAGCHRHGPCRPRQDLAARCVPPGRCRLQRGWWHHPAYRRLSGADEKRAEDYFPRYAGPRRLYRHARPRCQGDRHRGAGGRGR